MRLRPLPPAQMRDGSRLFGVSWDFATRAVIWTVFGVAVAAVACEQGLATRTVIWTISGVAVAVVAYEGVKE